MTTPSTIAHDSTPENSQIPQLKAAARKLLMARRAALDATQRGPFDATIGARILTWLSSHPVSTLGVFLPVRGEPDLQSLYVELANCGIQLALPVVIETGAPLQFAAWTPGDALTRDALQLLIPVTPLFLQPDALLVPCLGFNASRQRLGYGGGYFDRTLAQTPRPYALGIAYGCMQLEFAVDAHDIALDQVITEAQCLPVHAAS